MLALDHRGSFKKLINPQDPDSVTDEQAVKLKSEIINALRDQFSGLLIDDLIGLEAYLMHNKPYLLPLEKSGYLEQAGEKITEIEHTLADVANLGASGAKVLFYFNPHVDSAQKQLETAKRVVEECKAQDFPLFLEIVTYKPFMEIKPDDSPKLVLESLRAFVENGILPDVFKLEYPGNTQACIEISELLGNIPWILLTNPDPYEQFRKHLTDAVKAGCKGFLAGRALWKEVTSLQGEEKQKFLTTTLPQRFKEISDIAKASL